MREGFRIITRIRERDDRAGVAVDEALSALYERLVVGALASQTRTLDCPVRILRSRGAEHAEDLARLQRS
jgi:hypothetical protein